jgi:putative transposase
MSRTLLLHDRFAPPANPDAYIEVLDPHPHAGCIRVFDAGTRQDKYVKASDVLDDYYCGKLALRRTNQPRFSLAAQPTDPELMKRLDFVRSTLRRIHDIEELHGLSFLQAYRRAEHEHEAAAQPDAPLFPSQATIYRYRNCERSELPALRGDKNKGNRVPRYADDVVNRIAMAAERHYLLPHSPWSLKRLTEHVNGALPQEAPRLSIRYVKKVINQVVSPDVGRDRMLPADAIAGKSIAKKRIRVEAPFERVEQDAVHLPFVVKTPSGISSNVYLVHAIDCCTSYPLGWKFVIGSPTESDTLACIELYMSPLKAQLFRELGITGGNEASGTPGQIVLDNGPETKGRRIENVKKLGVDVKHCKANEAQGKPFTERINRSLKEGLEGVGGCTRLDGEDGKRDPIALGDPLMTLEELEKWVVRWYYEQWIHKPLERLRWDVVLDSSVKGTTPAARWKHYEDSCSVISLPPSRSEWLAALYEHTERKVSRKTGISLQGLNYKGDAIPRLIGKYGEHQPVHVLFNPDDYRHIYVYEGDEFPLITLAHEHLRPETPAWSFSDVKARFASTMTDFVRAPEAEQFAADLHARVVADSLAPKTKPKRRSAHDINRETRARDKEARAVERASKHPRPVPPPKAMSPGQLAPQAAGSPSELSVLGDAELLPVLSRADGGRLK